MDILFIEWLKYAVAVISLTFVCVAQVCDADINCSSVYWQEWLQC